MSLDTPSHRVEAPLFIPRGHPLMYGETILYIVYIHTMPAFSFSPFNLICIMYGLSF